MSQIFRKERLGLHDGHGVGGLLRYVQVGARWHLLPAGVGAVGQKIIVTDIVQGLQGRVRNQGGGEVAVADRRRHGVNVAEQDADGYFHIAQGGRVDRLDTARCHHEYRFYAWYRVIIAVVFDQ